MKVWFTADLHLGHGNIIKFCNRPFLSEKEQEKLRKEGEHARWPVSDESVKRHDAALIDAINDRVEKNDMLWILGDFCRGSLVEATRYRQRIACENFYLVWGNHDRREIEPVFKGVKDQGFIEVERQGIWINHYPMRSWYRSHHGTWHLYGHVHGTLADEDAERDHMLTMDVGVDARDYKPVSFEEIGEYMAPRVEKFKNRRVELMG